MIFKSPFARLGLLAWALATSATLAPRPLHGATAEYTSEILNLAGAPFELLPGPEGENGPNWGGLVSVSCFVHNLSEHPLSRLPLRVAMLPRREGDSTSYEWHAFTVDLGPARLASGDTTYLLLTVPMTVRAGARRYLVVPGVDGRYGAREVGDFVALLRTIERGEVQTRRVGRWRLQPDERPEGKTACAALRREADAGCPAGIERFYCIAPRSGEPLPTTTCASEPGVVARARRTHPEWFRNREPGIEAAAPIDSSALR